MIDDLRFSQEVDDLRALLTHAEGVGPQDPELRKWMRTQAARPEFEEDWKRLKGQFAARFMKLFQAPDVKSGINTLALRANATTEAAQ